MVGREGGHDDADPQVPISRVRFCSCCCCRPSSGFMVKVSNMVKGLCKQNLDFGGISAFGIVDSENPRNSEFEINMPAFPRGIFGTKKVWPGPFSLRITGKPSFGFQLSIFAQFDKNKLEFMARFELDPVSITINGVYFFFLQLFPTPSPVVVFSFEVQEKECCYLVDPCCFFTMPIQLP